MVHTHVLCVCVKIANADFDPDPTAVVFEESISEVCFNVSITNDGNYEQDVENFTILLSAPNPRVAVVGSAVEVFIVDSNGEWNPGNGDRSCVYLVGVSVA